MSYDTIAENLVLTIIQENEKYAMKATSSTQSDWDICYFTEDPKNPNLYKPHYIQVKSVDHSSKNKAVKNNFTNAVKANIESLFIVIYNHTEGIKGPVVYKFPMSLFKPRSDGDGTELVDSSGNIFYSNPKGGKQTLSTNTILNDDIKSVLDKYRVR